MTSLWYFFFRKEKLCWQIRWCLFWFTHVSRFCVCAQFQWERTTTKLPLVFILFQEAFDLKKVAAGGTATRKLAQRLGRTLDKLSSGASSGGNKTNPPGVHPPHQPPQQYVVYSPHGPPGPHQVSLQQYPPHSGYFQPPGYYHQYGGHQAIVYPGPHWAAEPHPIGMFIEPFKNTPPNEGKM